MKLPFRYLDRSAGLPTRDQELAKIEINTAFPDERFQPPADFVTVKHHPESPQLQMISEALYLIRGTYNAMFSVFPDDVVIFEAPLNDAYMQEILRIVRSVAGSRPIRYVVASHFHYDHIAGLRTVVSEGIPILTTPDAKEVIEESAEVRRTLRADALSRRPGKPIIETVMRQRVLDQGGVRARVYDFGPAPHVGQLLVAYFPDEKLLYVADLMDVLTEELVIAGVDAAPMRQKIQQLGLQVEHFVPVHGSPITGEQFEQAYRIRAKYLP